MKNLHFKLISAIVASFLFIGCGGGSDNGDKSSNNNTQAEVKKETAEQKANILKQACSIDKGTFMMSNKGYHCNGEGILTNGNYDRPTFSDECSKRRLQISSTTQGLLCESYLIIPPQQTQNTTDIQNKLKKECNGDFVPFVMDNTHSYTCSFGTNAPTNQKGWQSTCESIGFTFKDSGISYMCVGKTSDIKDLNGHSSSTTSIKDITKGTTIKQNQKYKITYNSGTFMRKYVIENSEGKTCTTTVDDTTSVYNEYDNRPYSITQISYGLNNANASIMVYFKYYTQTGSHLDFHVNCVTKTSTKSSIEKVTGFNIKGDYEYSIDKWLFFKNYGIDIEKNPYVYYFQKGYEIENLDGYYYSGLSIVINNVPTAIFDDRSIVKLENIDRLEIMYDKTTKKHNITIFDNNKNILIQKEYSAPIIENKYQNYTVYLVKMKDKNSKPLFTNYSL